MIKKIIYLLMFSFIYCCSTKNDDGKTENLSAKKPLFNLLPADKSGIDFNNTLNETATQNIYAYQYFYNGAGVAAGDINNDGLVDVFFAANQGSCKLYINKGDLKFQDITLQSKIATTGWCTGVAMADVNSDGWLDIYVCRSQDTLPANRANLLFINNKDNTFSEQAQQYGINDKGYASQGYFFDFDADNDLDLFICNHPYTWDNKIEKQAIQNATEDPFATDRLYRNDGNKFTDVTKAAGVHSFAFSLSAAIADYNNDGLPDIYVCNDYTMNDFLYINNGNGTFTDKVFDYFKHTSFYSMGSDMGDINNDGLTDLITLDMLPEDNRRQHLNMMRVDYDKYMAGVKWGFGYAYMHNNLQLNQGNNRFAEIGQLAGIEATDWSWTPLLQDFDNDGYLDIYITNGYKRDFTNADFIAYENEQARQQSSRPVSILDLLNKMPSIKISNYLYINNGKEWGGLTFKNATAQNQMNIPSFSQGAACADLDNDGDMDVLVNNINDKAFVFENTSNTEPENHFVNIVLKGTGKNFNAIGATVKIANASGNQIANNIPMRGFLSTSQSLIHFGLGKNSEAITATIKWPDGKMQQVTDLKIDKTNTINYNPDLVAANEKSETTIKLFSDETKKTKLDFSHIENEYIDFKREPLLPHKYSENGPGVAVADINGDGMEDVFIGNSKIANGKFFIQQKDGTFASSSSLPIVKSKTDDMGCLLFDADNDGDNDLYIVSGGSEYDDSTAYNDHLFLNDGKGHFTENKSSLPIFNSSGSCIVAGDYDADGDLDLFRGGRITPGMFPLAPRSFLLRNDNGKFTDVTPTLAPGLVKPGLVCAALFTDFDNSGSLDLIVTGEWMPLMIFKNEKEKFTNQTELAGLNETNGWWNSIAAADFNNDGLTDYIIGNYGLNTRLRADKQQPASVTYKDFDDNGSLDAIFCNPYPDGKSYPLVGRDEFIDQMRIFKKRLLRYDDYSGKTLSEIFTPDEMKGAQKVYAYNFSSSVLINKGNGKFEINSLPVQAQFAPVYGVITNDFDNDGNMDALLTGNFYGAEVNLARNDAFDGLYLKGDGKGAFTPVSHLQSGFMADKNSKGAAAVFINAQQKYKYIICNNNDKAQICQTNSDNNTSVFIYKAKPTDCKLTYIDASGKKHLQELYFGSGYLSSSSRTLAIPGNAKSIEVIDYSGRKTGIK